MIRPVLLATFAAFPCLFAGMLVAQQNADAPRLIGPEPFPKEAAAPPMQRQITNDIRRQRNYPDQPPLIPHAIEGYALDLNANKCLTCHSRKYTEQTQAPMISVTHFQDREGNTLGDVSPRRYLCLSCHVTQTAAAPLVRNTFTDIDALAGREPRGQ